MDEALQLAGLAKTKATQASTNESTISSDAGVAAANTMAYYTAIDPSLAPSMASIAYAETIAYSISNYAIGGVVPGQAGAAVPAIVHAGERVLTASQNSTYESIANSSSRASSVSLNYAPTIHGNADSAMLQEHSRQILSQVGRMIRPEARA